MQTRWKALAATMTAALVLAAGASLLPVQATHLPADKIGVAASSLEVMSAEFSPLAAVGTPRPLAGLLGEAGPDTTSETVSLFGATMRSSTPTDLIIRVTAECALWTNVTVEGNADSEAIATVKVWAELDGDPVLVTSDDPDEGKVVFCNRAYRMQTLEQENENFTINTFLRTRNAVAFQWIALNVGHGVHTLEVFAELETQVTGTGEAKAAVGKRVLAVEPVKLANDIGV